MIISLLKVNNSVYKFSFKLLIFNITHLSKTSRKVSKIIINVINNTYGIRLVYN